jgi:hypothetical protein
MTQAIGRAVRYGQSKPVHIHRFLSQNTIDLKIIQERSQKTLVKMKGGEWKLVNEKEHDEMEEKGEVVEEIKGAVEAPKLIELDSDSDDEGYKSNYGDVDEDGDVDMSG